ncbi:cell wall-binding repeat 2 family protein [Thermococcus argininiproducens]|uniref:Cell wall-binding repeat 2 family protein n=1 Tax=Thermococcus argininiproducens TaxID=2866384 RepID=A0A9E7SCH8_9EURY|nr:cell wall-binding repeat 2 family protein [Thermococcus argininiproducens]USG99829.1 cell wall-binding repeat 2 family protein [Thermococcus argininiproducens]
MMVKKGFAWLFGILLLASMIPLSQAQATLSIVILVSDNEADSALAEDLASILNATIVVTTWGVYDTNVTAEIMSYAPDKVIIIGGPDAVPKEYETDLSELGIPYVRWYGKDRYETNLEVIKYALEEYPELFVNIKIVIAHGRDLGAIKQVKGIQGKKFVIYVDKNLTNQTEIIGTLLKTKTVIIIKSPLMDNETAEMIRERVRERVQNGNITEEDIGITPEMAWEAIEIAINRTETAKEILDNLTIPSATKLLELAEKEIQIAKESYNEGNYGKAYGQAIAAKAHAEAVIRLAGKEWRNVMHAKVDIQLEREVYKLEIKLKVLTKAGIDVTEISEKIEAAKNAIQAGDYEGARELIEQAKNMLRDAFMQGRGKMKEINLPVGRGRGRP